MRVLAIGECMAELVPAEADGDYTLGFAGDTFNTAWYLAKLAPNADVAYFTALGTDAISENMRGFIADSGIDVTHVQAMPDLTVGMYLITLDAGERSFSYWRGQSAARHLARDAAALTAAVAAADLVYFSGITLAILPARDRATLLAALADARAAGKRTVFDPNLRPRLWADSAEMTAAIMDGAAVSDIALPSFEDEADWFGDQDPAATVARYAGAGVKTVVVKNGAGPVRFRSEGAEAERPVEPVAAIVDTTAAGDSFNAGFLAGILTDVPMSDCVARACALARVVVQKKGALVPIDVAKLRSGDGGSA